MVLKKKLTILWISKGQTHWDLHMNNIFICRRGIAVVNGSNRAMGENTATRNCVLELRLMMETSEISTSVNVNSVKISDLIVVLTWKSLVMEAYTSLKIMKPFLGEGGDSFTITLVALLFHLLLCKTILEQLISYEVTQFKKY